MCVLRHVWLLYPWTVGLQVPLSMGFSRQEYWNGFPFPPPGHLPEPGIEPASPVSPALAGRFFMTLCHLGRPWSRWPVGKLDECWKKCGNLSPLVLLPRKKLDLSTDFRRPGHRVGLWLRAEKSLQRPFHGKEKMTSCPGISRSPNLSFSDRGIGLHQAETKVDALFIVAPTNGAFLSVIHHSLFPHWVLFGILPHLKFLMVIKAGLLKL